MVQWDYFSNYIIRPIYTPAIDVIFLSLALISFVDSAETDVPSDFSETLIVHD